MSASRSLMVPDGLAGERVDVGALVLRFAVLFLIQPVWFTTMKAYQLF